MFNETIDWIIRDKNNNDRVLRIAGDTITAATRSGLHIVVGLRKNSTHVLKFNKTCISTCNIEMLAQLLHDNMQAFNNVYLFIALRELFDGVACDITRPAFYASFNDDPAAFADFFKSCSSDTKRQILFDHCCHDHDGKMNGVISCSTYVGANRYCAARCNNCDNAICKYCFAASLTAQRAGLKNKLRRIHVILTAVELSATDIPVIDSNMWPFFRFESFGDLNNVTQFDNYNLFARVNPDVNFTLWTKNPGVIQAAINNGTVIADNLIIGLSSLYLNTPELKKARKYPFIRFLFTVYDNDYIQAHDIQINCGAKHCITCGICYKYLHEFKHGLQLINERKK